MSEKLFILGLGNQKCGTSWLHKYLSQNDVFDGGPVKEYHIWDSLDTVNDVDLVRGPRVVRTLWSRTARARFQLQRDPDRYFDFFESLFSEKVRITADITPAYSGLGPDRIAYIKDGFAQKGITVKAVVLLRDPLSRIKSAVRFTIDRGIHDQGIDPKETDYAAALRDYYGSEHCRMRTAYDISLPIARAAFGPENLYVGFYETMFDPAEIERVSEFCGVPVKPEFAQVKVNTTKGTLDDDDALDAEIRHAYADTYAYCHAEFPETRSLWG